MGLWRKVDVGDRLGDSMAWGRWRDRYAEL